MRVIVFSILFVFSSLAIQAQKDSAAKAILKDMKAKYDSYKTMEVNFELELDIPQSPPELQSGQIIQAGEKYRVKLEDQAIYCDGTGIWVHLIGNNEVQINDLDTSEDSEMMSPKDLLRIYESEDFDYAITGEAKEDGKPVQYIEFKPLDRDSEYSKLKMTVESGKNQLKSLRIFGKDGSRYTIRLKSLKSNHTIDSKIFTFDESQFPGIRVEDLRLD